MDVRFPSNIIYDTKKTTFISSKIAAWSGFLFFLLTIFFCIWKLINISNSIPSQKPKPGSEVKYGLDSLTKTSDINITPDPKPGVKYDTDSAIKYKDNGKTGKPLNKNKKYVIKAYSLKQLRQKVMEETKGLSLDLNSVQLNINDYSITYSEGGSMVIGLSLLFDASKKDLNNRINNNVIPKNLPYKTIVLVDSKYGKGIYHTIVALVE
jgi:ABC-type transport system involved in multi-copper enzyme maturation permease subunit